MEALLKIKFNIREFEPIGENSVNQLVGGFSSSISVITGDTFAADGNNCMGANCSSGCGTGQNLSRCSTNTTYCM